MEKRFQGKVAIITGGAAGVGKAVASGLAKEGACVVINSRNEEHLNGAVAEIQMEGGNVTGVRGDVTNSADVKNIVNRTLELYGRIDILYNYVGGEASTEPVKLFIDQTEAYWNGMFEKNLKTAFFCSQAVLGTMIKQRYGKIINTAALAGRIGSPKMVLYSTVKGGIIAFTKALAKEVAEYNINVNCVSPGPTRTPGFNRRWGNQNTDKMTASIPLNRVGASEEVASAVIYLASDEAAFITGQTLAVDGGASMV
jgi:NAD(P)-dependent dehydrogenase (short-subunit alcohol dehydrogenase family)